MSSDESTRHDVAEIKAILARYVVEYGMDERYGDSHGSSPEFRHDQIVIEGAIAGLLAGNAHLRERVVRLQQAIRITADGTDGFADRDVRESDREELRKLAYSLRLMLAESE